MKKNVALLIAMILCLFACCALGEEAAMLRQDELINLRDELVESARSMPAEALTVYEEDGMYKLDYDAFALDSDQSALTDTAVIDGVEITPSENTLSDMRGSSCWLLIRWIILPCPARMMRRCFTSPVSCPERSIRAACCAMVPARR